MSAKIVIKIGNAKKTPKSLSKNSILPDSHVETALLYLVLDVAAFLFAHVAQHLGKHPFQSVVAHLAAYGMVTVVTNVERSAIQVAGVLRGIAVMPTELYHIVPGTQDTGDYQLVQRNALGIETVEKGLPDVLQEHCGTRHKIRYGAIHAVNMIVGTDTDVHQFLLPLLGILTVLDRAHSPTGSGRQLDTVGIGETGLVVVDTTDRMVPLLRGFFLTDGQRCGFFSVFSWHTPTVIHVREYEFHDKENGNNTGKSHQISGLCNFHACKITHILRHASRFNEFFYYNFPLFRDEARINIPNNLLFCAFLCTFAA